MKNYPLFVHAQIPNPCLKHVPVKRYHPVGRFVMIRSKLNRAVADLHKSGWCDVHSYIANFDGPFCVVVTGENSESLA